MKKKIDENIYKAARKKPNSILIGITTWSEKENTKQKMG